MVSLFTKDTKHQTEYIRVLMRSEKEKIKKQARSNKQTNKAKQHSTYEVGTFPKKNKWESNHVLMGDEKEGRKKQARSNKQ